MPSSCLPSWCLRSLIAYVTVTLNKNIIERHKLFDSLFSTIIIKGSDIRGAFVWDQSGIRIIGIMRVSVCLGAILIPEYLDFYSQEQNSRNIFRNKFLFRNIPNERALGDIIGTLRSRTRRLLGRGDREKAWSEDGVVSAGNLS